MTEPTVLSSDLHPIGPGNAAPSLLLHAEHIGIGRRRVATGSVDVARKTVEHDETVSTELADERVEITRVSIGRVVDTAPPVREVGDTTIISVVEEMVVVEKRLVLKEEIHLRRVRTTRVHSETVTLRTQQAVVTRTTFHDDGVSAVVDVTHQIQQQDQ